MSFYFYTRVPDSILGGLTDFVSVELMWLRKNSQNSLLGCLWQLQKRHKEAPLMSTPTGLLMPASEQMVLRRNIALHVGFIKIKHCFNQLKEKVCVMD